MKYPTVFHLISAISDREGVTCVLVGGFAVNYYKVTRQTADVDFLITKNDFEKICGLLQEEGYTKDYTQKVFTRLRANPSYLMDIDFMFVDKETLDRIIKDAREIYIAKKKFIVPSLEHLIALKLHSIKHNPRLRRSKDMPDIIDLVRINKVNAKSNGFKKLCLKYGTKELYSEILNSI